MPSNGGAKVRREGRSWFFNDYRGGRSSHACGCWIKGGAIVMGGKTIWDVSVFRYLLLRYPAIKVSVHIQVMRVDAASTTSMHTPTSRKNATGGVPILVTAGTPWA
jgi:hypothetical protein